MCIFRGIFRNAVLALPLNCIIIPCTSNKSVLAEVQNPHNEKLIYGIFRLTSRLLNYFAVKLYNYTEPLDKQDLEANKFLIPPSHNVTPVIHWY